MCLHPHIEALEARIAPAVFFLSGTDKTVSRADGTSANDAASQNLAQSDIAVLLQAGDSLVLDADNDKIFDPGETTLVTVTAGRGLVFAKDFASGGKLTTDFLAGGDAGYSVLVQSDGKILVAGSVGIGADVDFALVRYNPNGTLDTSFDGDGFVNLDFGGEDVAKSVVLQGDGKIVVAGYTMNGADKNFAVARFNPDGTPDTSFNGTGRTTTAVSTDEDFAHSVVVQGDGKIVVAGQAKLGGNFDFAVVRYNADGTLDTGFNLNAKALASSSTIVDVKNVTVGNTSGLKVGSYLVGPGIPLGAKIESIVSGTAITIDVNATATASALTLQAFDSTPPVVASGATNGTTVTFQSSQTGILTPGMFITGSGIPVGTTILGVSGDGLSVMISAAATTAASNVTFQFFQAANGSGVLTTAIGTGDDIATDLAVLSDGKIVVGGSASNGTNLDFAVVRYNANGSPDTTFDADGKVVTSLGNGDDAANSLVVQSDGRIVLAGFTTRPLIDNPNPIPDTPAHKDFAIVRYNTNGGLDTSFNGTGKVMVPIGATGDDIAYDVVVQSDGRIVVVGEARDGANAADFAMIRLTAGGALDATFNSTGKVRTTFGLTEDGARGVALQADGRIVLAGSAANATGDFALARYAANGVLDSTFGAGGANGAFDANDLSGLAVSSGFKGKIAVGIDGSIITALDDAGKLTAVMETQPVVNFVLTVQHASIAGLEINGAVTGNVFAGGSISNVHITGAVAGNLATGSAVTGNDAHLKAADVSFNHGGQKFAVASFDPLPGEAGGSITDVRLDGGVHNIRAGNGGSTNFGVPGRGGSISNVIITMEAADPVWIIGGKGGSSATAAGAAGGSISGVTLRLTVDATDNLQFIAGGGGNGGGIGSGGAGGSIFDSTITTPGSIDGSLILQAGAGGAAAGFGNGGAGGSVVDTVVQALGAGETIRNFLVTGGAGGDSAQGGGGAGGRLLGNTFITEATIGNAAAETVMSFVGGNGGAGKKAGGVGGALLENTFVFRGPVVTAHFDGTVFKPQPIVIQSGHGGDLNAAATAKAIAGVGGAITTLDITQLVDINVGMTIRTGDGGAADAANVGRGGGAGSITNANIFSVGAVSTDLLLQTGNGGAAPNGNGHGGSGGRIVDATITAPTGLKSLTLQAGNGADAEPGAKGKGGVGGSLETIRILTGAVTGAVKLQAGAAGKSSDVAGTDGGRLVFVDLRTIGNIAGGIQLTGGAGGAVNEDGAGGTGGGILRTMVTISGGAASLAITGGAGGNADDEGRGGIGGAIATSVVRSHSPLPTGTITSGAGGAGGSDTGAGGAGGKIGTLNLSAINSTLAVVGGAGGSSNSAARGGAGGTIDGVFGSVDAIRLAAGDAGNSPAGSGGTGGSIRNVAFDAVGRFVQALVAGNGGNGTTAGAGGSVAKISIPGDIGDFTKSFDVVSSTGMGGIVAGQKGNGTGKATNGSISTVFAERIATMIAGRPAANAIGYTNGVFKITNITTGVLGADVNNDGDFDFIDGGLQAGYQPDDARTTLDGDTALDGLVVVRKNSLINPPVPPLQRVQV